MAVGYTSGDPNKVNRAGDTMTGPLTLPGPPADDDQAATKAYVDGMSSNGGGGGEGVPSGTVVAETSYGQSATAGVATTYSRGDHTHGTPAALTLSGLGGQQRLIVRRAYVTSGDYQPAVNANFTPIPGLSIAIPAEVGDYVELAIMAMIKPGNSDNFYDGVVLVDGLAVRYASNGTGTPPDEGWPALYPSPGSFRTTGAIFSVLVEAGDLDDGDLVFGIASKGAGSGIGDPRIFANASYPFAWRVINHRSVLLS